MKIKKFNQLGVSLIEVIVIVLIAGVLVTVIANLPAAISLIGVGNHEATAKQIVAKKISDVRSLGYDNLANNAPNGVAISDTRLTGLNAGSGNLLIEECPVSVCTQSEQVKQITIKVSWKEAGKNKNFQIVTLISKGGLR